MLCSRSEWHWPLQVSFKRLFVDASYCQVSFFFSLIGLMNAALLWPVLLLLHFSGLEVVVWNRVPWLHLVVAGALSLRELRGSRPQLRGRGPGTLTPTRCGLLEYRTPFQKGVPKVWVATPRSGS